MSERMSPAYRAGMIHGAWDAARPARYRLGFHGSFIGWQYRRGFARAFRMARGLPPLERKHQPAGRCWCRAYHANSFQAGQQVLAAKMASPDRIDWSTDATQAPPPPAGPGPLERARRAAQR
jgi:hypothetical protein